jgi:hypothetical protein
LLGQSVGSIWLAFQGLCGSDGMWGDIFIGESTIRPGNRAEIKIPWVTLSLIPSSDYLLGVRLLLLLIRTIPPCRPIWCGE